MSGRVWWRWVVVGTVMCVLGCTAATLQQETPAGPTPADGLANLRDLFRQADSGVVPLPKSVKDFVAVEAFYPVASPFMLTGAVECSWGARLSEGGGGDERLLAWERDCGKGGGWALFQDGEIRKITAAEFSAARRAEP